MAGVTGMLPTSHSAQNKHCCYHTTCSLRLLPLGIFALEWQGVSAEPSAQDSSQGQGRSKGS